MRLIRLFGRLSLRLVILLVLAVVLMGHGWLPALLGWLAFGYLIWRAWPAVRSDLRFLWTLGRVRSTKTIARF